MRAKIDKDKLEKLKRLDWKRELHLRPFRFGTSLFSPPDFYFYAETGKGRFKLSRGVSSYLLGYETIPSCNPDGEVSVQISNSMGKDLWKHCQQYQQVRKEKLEQEKLVKFMKALEEI